MLAELTELLELGPLLYKPVRNLSLGERMKCEIAAALLHRPNVVFLDEPTIPVQKFTEHKTIIVQLGDCQADLHSYGEVVSCAGGRFTLRVPKAETAHITERLLADLPVIDLLVEDTPIEEVIERVFASLK